MIWGSKAFLFGKQIKVCEIVASGTNIFDGMANIFKYNCHITYVTYQIYLKYERFELGRNYVNDVSGEIV